MLKSPCSICIVSPMCKVMCTDITEYVFKNECYDKALESILLRQTNQLLRTYKLKVRYKGLLKIFHFIVDRNSILKFEKLE